uniref:Uncharacterized protein n=1 Tax=Anguilla anguilla TaxID=7936 RepID=A0A0E9UQ75_ANGAN
MRSAHLPNMETWSTRAKVVLLIWRRGPLGRR